MTQDAAQGAVVGNEIPNDDFLNLEEIMETAPDIACPPVAEWAQVSQAESWLVAAAERLANSARQLERVAGAGLLSRLYVSPAEVMIPLADRPIVRAKVWAQGLSAEQVEMILDRTCEASWALMERIGSLQSLPAELQTRELRSILLDRDDLESIKLILCLIGSEARLAENLRDLDTVAKAHMSAMANLLPPIEEDPEADRLIAVTACDPSAWWGAS